jgi:hypothetical protein
MLSIVLLILFVVLAFAVAPREKKGHAHIHGAGQIGLVAALALFGVDYFTSYYYATGEMLHALHPYGLQNQAYIAATVIAFANLVFGALYMYSLGPFNEGGGSYTASMRYLWPTVSLIVAITLVEDYILTIVVSALSGGDQLLSILGQYGKNWVYHFLIGALLAFGTWFLTIRGRGESARVVFAMITIFVGLTLTMAVGLVLAVARGVPPTPEEATLPVATVGQALMHLLTASMKGMVALTGLEAVSNGIQFMIDDDAGIVRWGKQHLPRLNRLWHFYSGRSGIGRFVQTSFLFYGGLTTLFLTFFALHFHVFDGTAGRTLVGNLAFIGFDQIPGGTLLFWTYQILAVLMLSAASMTAFQDAQATEWRDVAIGEIPEAVVYRDARGTFTRSVTFTFVAAVIIMLLVRGQTTHAIPFYSIGVFLPITAMGLAIRKHVLTHATGRARRWGAAGATFAAALSAIVFLGQIFGKWSEGGWVRLITFGTLFTLAHVVLLSPAGHRAPGQVYRIVRDKAKVQGAMASIVEWQAFRMQEYRYRLMIALGSMVELFGVGQMQRRVPALAMAEASRPVVGAADAGRARPAPRLAAAAKPKNDHGTPTERANTETGAAPLADHTLPPRIQRHRVILPLNALHEGTFTALRYAQSLSRDVTAVHVAVDRAEAEKFQQDWEVWGEGVRLVVLESEHGLALEPLLRYIVGIMDLREEREAITIVVPQSIRPRWWSNLMRTQMGTLLRLSLPLETGVVITDVPYHLDGEGR